MLARLRLIKKVQVFQQARHTCQKNVCTAILIAQNHVSMILTTTLKAH